MSKKALLELINKDNDELNSYLKNIGLSEFREMIRLGLLEQDRDTRHSCAEECLDKETTHNLIVEMWNSMAENAEEIRSKDLYDIKKDIFNKLVIKYNLTYINNNLRIYHQSCFACIFYNKNYVRDYCYECPFLIYELPKNYPSSQYYRVVYCEKGISSPYRKIQCIDGSKHYLKNLSDWHIEYFKKHCIEICDLFIE